MNPLWLVQHINLPNTSPHLTSPPVLSFQSNPMEITCKKNKCIDHVTPKSPKLGSGISIPFVPVFALHECLVGALFTTWSVVGIRLGKGW